MKNKGDIDIDKLINYLIDNKDIISVNVPKDINNVVNSNTHVELFLNKEKIKFIISKYTQNLSNNVYKLSIIKDIKESGGDSAILLNIEEEHFNKIKESFVYLKEDLISEIKLLIRDNNISNVIK